MTSIDIFQVWDRDGEEHEIELYRCGDGYTVTLDNVIYTNAENYRKAKEEIIDAINHRGWTFTNPGKV